LVIDALDAMAHRAARAALLAALLVLGPHRAACATLFGPTANLLTPAGAPDFKESIAQLLALVNEPASWPALRAAVTASRGALHARDSIVAAMTPAQRSALGAGARALGLGLSIEMGGALCGAGAGAARGAQFAALARPLAAAGAALDFVLVESVFSRTRAACPAQSLHATAAEAADFAAAAAAAAPAARLFLYDALPHFAVGAAAVGSARGSETAKGLRVVAAARADRGRARATARARRGGPAAATPTGSSTSTRRSSLAAAAALARRVPRRAGRSRRGICADRWRGERLYGSGASCGGEVAAAHAARGRRPLPRARATPPPPRARSPRAVGVGASVVALGAPKPVQPPRARPSPRHRPTRP